MSLPSSLTTFASSCSFANVVLNNAKHRVRVVIMILPIVPFFFSKTESVSFHKPGIRILTSSSLRHPIFHMFIVVMPGSGASRWVQKL